MQSERISNEAKHKDDYFTTRDPDDPHCSNYKLLLTVEGLTEDDSWTAKWISSSLSAIAHCHNDAWPEEIVCADKRPPSSVFYSLYLFQGIRGTNTSPLVLKAHKSCFNKLVSLQIVSDKASGFYLLPQSLFGWLLFLQQNNSFIDQHIIISVNKDKTTTGGERQRISSAGFVLNHTILL